MKKRKIPGYDDDGVPLTTGTPSWLEYLDATDGSSPGDPALDAFSNGWTGYTPTALAHCGIIDCGEGSFPRYVHVACESPQTFIALDTDGNLISGATPAWLFFKNINTDADVTPPTISSVPGSSYIHRFSLLDPPEYCYGTIDLGSSASPQYLGVLTDSERAIIGNFSPPVGDSLAPVDSVTCDITDDSGRFTSILLMARFAGKPSEVVYTSSDGFEPGYDLFSTVASITDGIRLVIRRQWGWHAAPTLRPILIDEDGQETP